MLSTAVAPGVLPRAAVSAVRGWVLPMLVLLLTAGVIGMHSLGPTHHVPVTAAMTTADMPITTPEPALANTKDRVEFRTGFVAQIAMSAHMQGAVMEGAVMGGHGLMAMCIAVLPLLALLLHRAHRDWSRLTQQRIPVPPLAGSGGRWRPIPNTAVSLTRLCIRRT